MIELHFSGNYYEIGYELGTKIQKLFQIPPISKKTIDFSQENGKKKK